jgi:uncharacterized protein
MNGNPRVVFDSSTLVSVVLRPASPARRAFSLALGLGVICINGAALDRLRAVLSSARFDRFMARRSRLAFVGLLSRNAWLCPSSLSEKRVVRRPRCNRDSRSVLDLAIAGEADVIVSSDRQLLASKSWRRIPIVAPEQFVDGLEQT